MASFTAVFGTVTQEERKNATKESSQQSTVCLEHKAYTSPDTFTLKLFEMIVILRRSSWCP